MEDTGQATRRQMPSLSVPAAMAQSLATMYSQQVQTTTPTKPGVKVAGKRAATRFARKHSKGCQRWPMPPHATSGNHLATHHCSLTPERDLGLAVCSGYRSVRVQLSGSLVPLPRSSGKRANATEYQQKLQLQEHCC